MRKLIRFLYANVYANEIVVMLPRCNSVGSKYSPTKFRDNVTRGQMKGGQKTGRNKVPGGIKYQAEFPPLPYGLYSLTLWLFYFLFVLLVVTALSVFWPNKPPPKSVNTTGVSLRHRHRLRSKNILSGGYLPGRL